MTTTRLELLHCVSSVMPSCVSSTSCFQESARTLSFCLIDLRPTPPSSPIHVVSCERESSRIAPTPQQGRSCVGQRNHAPQYSAHYLKIGGHVRGEETKLCLRKAVDEESENVTSTQCSQNTADDRVVVHVPKLAVYHSYPWIVGDGHPCSSHHASRQTSVGARVGNIDDGLHGTPDPVDEALLCCCTSGWLSRIEHRQFQAAPAVMRRAMIFSAIKNETVTSLL
eukprot:scaffold1836_cov181-Pinguiococcus_pyrenoidosus.AAC.1